MTRLEEDSSWRREEGSRLRFPPPFTAITGSQAALNSVSFDCNYIPWKPTALISLKKYLEASNPSPCRIQLPFSSSTGFWVVMDTVGAFDLGHWLK